MFVNLYIYIYIYIYIVKHTLIVYIKITIIIAQATKRIARQRKIYNNVPPVYIL